MSLHGHSWVALGDMLPDFLQPFSGLNHYSQETNGNKKPVTESRKPYPILESTQCHTLKRVFRVAHY